jgi:endonuclease YncB( thermonuclease family)
MLLALFAWAAAGQSFSCKVVAVHDGDTMRCADGTRVRLQGIDANELDGTCHTRCARLPADQARRHLSDFALGRTASCRPTGTSYRRITAWCAVAAPDGSAIDLSCAQVVAQAAIVWRRYDPRHRLDHCAATLPSVMVVP